MSPLPHLPLGARGELRLHFDFRPGAVSLALEGGEVPVRLDFSTRPDGVGFSRSPRSWTLSKLPGRGPTADALLEFRESAEVQLGASYRDDRSEEGNRRLLGHVQLLTAMLQGAAAHLQGQLEPCLASLARRFHQGLRWPVYEALAADSSGRLAQLAASAPGALAFALTHAHRSDEQGHATVVSFRDAVLRGEKLDLALGPLLEDWALFGLRRTPPRRRAARRHGVRPDVFSALATAPAPERTARIAQQRLLLRRALPAVGGTLLWLPPPLAFAPEDVPGTARAQLKWFKALKGWSAFTTWWPEVPRDVQERFVRWLSAHAVAVAELKSVDPMGLFDVARLGGVRLARRQPMNAVLRQLVPPHARPAPEGHPPAPGALNVPIPWEQRVARLVEADPHRALRAPDGTRDLQLPAPFPGCTEAGLQVTPLATASALHAEGQQMSHCVASYLEQAAEGRSFFFAAEAEGMRLTVQVNGPAHAPALGPFLGRRNCAPSPEAAARIRSWWEDTSAACGLMPRFESRPAPDDEEDFPF
jgi:hypothetical protein